MQPPARCPAQPLLGTGRKVSVGAVAALAACSAFAAPDLTGVQLPAGFKIEVWTDQTPLAREIAFGPKGTVFVGSMKLRRRHAGRQGLRHPHGQREARRQDAADSGLNNPNGVAVRNGALYVGEVNRIVRYDDIENHLDKPPQPVVITRLPTEQHHGWRYIAFGPDDKLYVAIGAPCNVCDKGDVGYAQILRMNPDGTGREPVAKGVRNSVGFAWQPKIQQALVHRQRPRPARRQRAGLRAESSRQGRRRLWISRTAMPAAWSIPSSAS